MENQADTASKGTELRVEVTVRGDPTYAAWVGGLVHAMILLEMNRGRSLQEWYYDRMTFDSDGELIVSRASIIHKPSKQE